MSAVERNQLAIGEVLSELTARVYALEAAAQLRDQVFAQQTQQLLDLQQRMVTMQAMQMGSGSTA